MFGELVLVVLAAAYFILRAGPAVVDYNIPLPPNQWPPNSDQNLTNYTFAIVLLRSQHVP